MLKGSEIHSSQSLPAQRQTIFMHGTRTMLHLPRSGTLSELLLRRFIPCQQHRHDASIEDETQRQDVLRVTVTVEEHYYLKRALFSFLGGFPFPVQ